MRVIIHAPNANRVTEPDLEGVMKEFPGFRITTRNHPDAMGTIQLMRLKSTQQRSDGEFIVTSTCEMLVEAEIGIRDREVCFHYTLIKDLMSIYNIKRNVGQTRWVRGRQRGRGTERREYLVL